MKSRPSTALAGVSLLVIASAVSAQAPPAQRTPQEAAAAFPELEEIIITARRKEESLQNVPESVSVVSSAAVQQYNLLTFTDLEKVVPGLQLQSTPNGFSVAASLRGVTYNEITNTAPTVRFYMNDAPVENEIIFSSLFDIGQIEVLKGPQGTLRGEIAPSGSITIASQRPDLYHVGGYAQVQVGNLHENNIQGAFSVPIVEDKFAIRIAGVRDVNPIDDVHSIHNSASPNETTEAGRLSARFAPNDDINAVFTYLHINRHQLSFAEVYGPGAPGGFLPGTSTPAPPANYNGPPISSDQLASVDAAGSHNSTQYNIVTGQLDWNIGSQKLSWVGSYSNQHTNYENSGDGAHSVPGYTPLATGDNTNREWTQELRLSSVERLFGRFDYTVGFFYDNVLGHVRTEQGQTYLPGAFGSPLGAPVLGPPNPNYVLRTFIDLPGGEIQYAGFLNLTFHLNDSTEISAGARYNSQSRDETTSILFSPAYAGVAIPAAICGPSSPIPQTRGGRYGATYPGVCDIPVNQPTYTFPDIQHHQPVVYNVELSHHFNEDLMAYFRTASSWREGVVQVGPAVAAATTPSLVPYVLPSPEKSQTYEVGLKSEFLDKRLLFDVDYFHQDYDGFIYTTLPFYYLQVQTVAGRAPQVTTANLITLNVPAIVDGVEFNVAAKITPHWSTSAAASWTDGRLNNAKIPCSPPGITGVPTVAQFGSTQIFTCTSNTSTSTAPRWSANLSSEYAQALMGNVNGFIRGLAYYFSSDPYASTTYVIPAYAKLDLYLGVRGASRAWEVSLYGKNITDKRAITSIGNTQTVGLNPNQFGNTGYYSIAHLKEREYGVTARYSFGSR
jgi:iron complex outermembrane receptor protein